MSKSLKEVSINEYAGLIGYSGDNPSIDKVQKYAEELGECIWDYPLEELDYVLAQEHINDIIKVNDNGNIRLCELI